MNNFIGRNDKMNKISLNANLKSKTSVKTLQLKFILQYIVFQPILFSDKTNFKHFYLLIFNIKIYILFLIF